MCRRLVLMCLPRECRTASSILAEGSRGFFLKEVNSSRMHFVLRMKSLAQQTER